MAEGLDSFFLLPFSLEGRFSPFCQLRVNSLPPYLPAITGLFSFGKRSCWELTLQKPVYCTHPLQFALHSHHFVSNNIPLPPRQGVNKWTALMRLHRANWTVLSSPLDWNSDMVQCHQRLHRCRGRPGSYGSVSLCQKLRNKVFFAPRQDLFPIISWAVLPKPISVLPERFLFPFSWTCLQSPFIFLSSLLSMMLLDEAW